ncbi:MAG: hypothetical protein H7Y86_00010 [Rhizobacter sp.]|nr:hypothetical protein [Ferruginibacter sp.]
MKKILLTLICGFGLTAAFAQEPAKVAKKKASKVRLAGTTEAAKPRLQEKLAIEAGKAAPAASAKGSKSSAAAEKAN